MEAFQNQVNVHLLSNQPDSAGGKAVTPDAEKGCHGSEKVVPHSESWQDRMKILFRIVVSRRGAETAGVAAFRDRCPKRWRVSRGRERGRPDQAERRSGNSNGF
jgi:hypothetical protein